MKRHIFTVSILLVAAQLFGQESRFWVGGSGKWADENHWATVSGGEPGATVPESGTSVVFDENSFSGGKNTVTVGENVKVAGLKSAGADFVFSGKTGLTVKGTIDVDSKVDFGKLRGELVLSGSGKVNLPTELIADIVIEGGSWTLVSDLTTDGNITLKSGSFITRGHKIECAEFVATDEAVRLNIEKSTIVCDKWNCSSASNLTLEAYGSEIGLRNGLAGKFITDENLKYDRIINLNNTAKSVSITREMLIVSACPANAYQPRKDAKIKLIINGGVGSYKVIFGKTSAVVVENPDKLPLRYYVSEVYGQSNNIEIPNLEPGSYYAYTYEGSKPTKTEMDRGQSIMVDGTPDFNNIITIDDDGAAKCYGDDIILKGAPSGGTPGYDQFKWKEEDHGVFSEAITAQVEIGWNAEMYFEDAEGCGFYKSYKYYEPDDPETEYTNQPEPLVLTKVEQVEAACVGTEKGKIKATAHGGTGTLSIESIKGEKNYTPTKTSLEYSGVYAGTYWVTVKDGNECKSESLKVTVESVSVPQATQGGEVEVCACDASVDIKDAKVTVGKLYEWRVKEGSESIIKVKAGDEKKLEPTIEVLSEGVGFVQMWVVNGTCDTLKLDRKITVVAQPIPELTTVSGDVCETIILDAIAKKGGSLEAKYTGGDDESGIKIEPSDSSNKLKITATKQGTYKFKVLETVTLPGDKKCVGESNEEITLKFYLTPELEKTIPNSGKYCGVGAPVTLSIKDNKNTEGTTWSWNVDEGAYTGINGSTASSVSYVPQDGDLGYDVKISCVATNHCTSKTEHFTLHFYPKPEPSFITDLTKHFCGVEGEIEANVTDGNKISWVLPAGVQYISSVPANGQKVSGTKASVKFKLTNGDYNSVHSIQLIEKNDGDCVNDPLFADVYFDDVPSLELEYATPAEVCAGGSFDVAITLKNCLNVDVNCDVPSNFKFIKSNGNKLYYQYVSTYSNKDAKDTIDLYPVVAPSSTCVTSNQKQTINLNIYGIPKPRISNDTTVCGKVIDFTVVKSFEGSSLSISPLSNTKKASQNVYEIVSMPEHGIGVGQVTLSETHNSCTSPQQTITIKYVPEPTVTGKTEKNICAGFDTCHVKVDTANCDIVGWESVNGGTFSDPTGCDVVYTFSALDKSQNEATLKFKYKGKTPCDNSEKTFTVKVNIKDLPTATIEVDDTKAVCKDYERTYKLSGTTTYKSYEWYIGDELKSTDKEFKNKWSVAGPFTVKVKYKDEFGCSPDPIPTFDVTVNALPSVSVPKEEDFCTGNPAHKKIIVTAPTATDVTWSGVGSDYLSDKKSLTPEFNSSVAGVYTLKVTVIDANQCVSDSTVIVNNIESPTIHKFVDTIKVCFGSENVPLEDIAEIKGDMTLVESNEWKLKRGEGFVAKETLLDGAVYWTDDADWTAGPAVIDLEVKTSCGIIKDSVVLVFLPEMVAAVGSESPFLISENTLIEVKVTAEHNNFSQVGYYLVSPTGKKVKLFYYFEDKGTGCASIARKIGRVDDLTFTTVQSTPLNICNWVKENGKYTGSFGITDPNGWTNIYGEDPAKGGWSVMVIDDFASDEGILLGATISFTDKNRQGKMKTIEFNSKAIAQRIADHASTSYYVPMGLRTSCYNTCDARAIANAVGGSGIYNEFIWANDPAFTDVFETKPTVDLCAGTYYIRVVDDNKCHAESSIEVLSPEEIKIYEVGTHQDLTCFGDSTASITVTSENWIGKPYYKWYDSTTNKLLDSVPAITGLYAGKFRVVVSDVNECMSDTVFTVNGPSQIEVEKLEITKTCKNDGVAAFTIKENSGTPGAGLGYKLYYKNGESAPTFTEVTTGLTATDLPSSDSLIFRIEDGVGCFIDTTISTVQKTLTLETKADTIKCFGGTTSATVKVITGVAKSFKWDDAEEQTSATATGLKAGTYIVTVEDEIGCTTTDTVTIEENKKIEPSVEYIDPLCYGYEGNVRVKASAKGGVPVSNSYSYEWLDESNSTMSTDSIFENAVPGTTYYLRVKDQYCKVEDTVEIANPAQLTVVAGNEKASECSAATGSAEVTSVTGGLAPYKYNWYALFDENTSVGDTYNASNLGVDFYVVEVTDSLGCKKTDTVEITGGGNIAFEVEMAGVTCATDPNGQAHVYNVTSNGSAATNVKIFWNNGNDVLSQADTIKTLAMGLNKFMVSADEGCRAGLVEIDNSRALRVADEKYTPLVHGDDACDGGFEIVVAGGSGEYEQILTDAAGEKVPSTLVNDTVIVATGLCAGTYNLHIDIVGGSTCPVDFPITIISNALSYDTISASNGITHVKCMGDSTGIINGNAIGGYFYDSYVYEWRSDVWGEDSVRTTASIDGLPAGSYTLKVFQYHTVGTETDTLTYEHTFVVNEPTTKFEVLADSIRVEGSHCYDAIGSISIGVNAEAFNGTPASYTFSYDGWATDYVTTTPELTNLKSGDYRMVVKDVNGCSFVDTITIEDLSNFAIDTVIRKEPDCHGFNNGFIKVKVDGGNGSLHFSWTKDGKAISDSTALLVGLEAATYVVTIVDDSSCVKVQEIVLGQPDTLLANVVFDQPIVCYGDTVASFHSAPMGGTEEFSFLWTDAITGDTLSLNSAITNAGEGSYAIKVVDKNMCWANDTIVISYPDSLYVEMAMEKSECAGATGYAAVKINGGVAPFVVSWTAKYGTDTIIRTDTLLPGVMVDTLKNIGPDMYYVTVADALGTGCSVVDSVEVLDDGDLKFIPTKTNDIYCINIANGGAVIPRVMNGKTFEIYSDAKIIWNAGKDTVNIGDTLKTLHYGKNIVQVISMPDGCRQYGELELDDDLALHVSVENIPVRGVETASNGALIAEVTGGYPNYTCIWQNEAGDTLQVDTTDAKASLFGLNVGRYILYVKDQNPETCEIIDTIDIKFEPLRYDTIVLNNVTCNGWNDGKIEVKGKGGLHRPYFYEWSSPMWPDSVVVNTPDIADLKAGSYMLKMWQLYSSDSVECLYDTIVITEPSNKLSIEKLLVDSIPSHCYDSIGAIVINQPAGFEKLFGGSAPFTYTFSRDSWSVELSSGNEEKVEVTGLTIGDYKLYVRDSLGCDYNTTITINDLSEFRIKNVVVEKPICYDEFGTITVTPTSKNGGFKYSWMNDTTALADTTAELLGIKAGTYIVKVTDDSLCVKFDTIEVTQPKPIIFSVSNTIENSCFNVADGEVSFANITGGWESYKQFLFVNPDDSTDVKLSVDAKVDTTIFTLSLNEENYNLISGKYNVLVKDAVGCLSDPVSLVVNSKYPQIDINSYISTADVTGPDCQVYTADGKISDNGLVKINFKQVSGTVSFKFDDRSVTEQQQPTFDKVTSGNHLLTIGYTDDLVCAVTDTIKVKGKDSFAIEEAGFYQNGKNSPAIFTCADNELSAYVTASGKFSYSFYAQYIEEPVETVEVPVDTVKADSNGVAYVSRYRKLRFYADSLEQDSSATEALVVVPEEVKKPAYSKLETINGVVYAVFTDSSATNKGWADFMPYGGETYYYVSVSNGKCMDIDSIKATAMKPVNKLNARLSDDETFKLVAGRYEVAEGALVTFEANTPEFEFGDAQSVFSENYWTWKHIGGSDYSALIPEIDSIGTGNPMTAKTYGELVVQAIDTVVFTAYDDIYRIDTTLSCVFTDKLEINSIDGIKPMEVFTPNGDEYNETWRIDGLASYSNVTIYVFNRWGGRVWQYSGSGLDYSNAHEWDGRNAKNKPLPAGTYYYVIQCSDDVLVGKKVTGPVTIIR